MLGIRKESTKTVSLDKASCVIKLINNVTKSCDYKLQEPVFYCRKQKLVHNVNIFIKKQVQEREIYLKLLGFNIQGSGMSYEITYDENISNNTKQKILLLVNSRHLYKVYLEKEVYRKNGKTSVNYMLGIKCDEIDVNIQAVLPNEVMNELSYIYGKRQS